MGPEMPERGSKTSTVPVVRATFGIFSALSKWFPVATGDHGRNLGYINMTRRQSNNQWSGGIASHPAPQKFRVQKSAGKFLVSISGVKTAFSLLIIFQRAKLSMRSITHLCWCNWRTFWRKNAAGRSPKGALFSHGKAPAHRALATHKKLVFLGFQCLDHPPYSPDLAPSDYHLFHGLKKQLKGPHFSPDAEVIAAAETWLDGQPSDFF